MLVKDAKRFGKVSTGNSKMPGTTYAVDAFACKTGSKLRAVEGTPCASCYAIKLQKLRPSVDQGWRANLAAWLSADADEWAQAMAFQILRYNVDGFHRWFDAGDLESKEMFEAILQVCRMTPHIQHWLPTQERAFVHANDIPPNLTVRISASRIDGAAPNYPTTSSVVRDKKSATCPAQHQSNSCGACRNCWRRDVPHVTYPKH